MTNISQTRRSKLVSGLRSYLRSIASRRQSGTVTADDANTYLSRNGVSSRSVRARQSLINSAFQGGNFVQAGVTTSNRPVAKSRYITEWMTF